LHIHSKKAQTINLKLLRIDASQLGATQMLTRDVQAAAPAGAYRRQVRNYPYTSYESWQPTVTLPIPRDFKSGIYVVHLTNAAGHSKVYPIAIETPDAPARVVVLLPWLTRLSAYSHGLTKRKDSQSLYTGWTATVIATSLLCACAVERPVEKLLRQSSARHAHTLGAFSRRQRRARHLCHRAVGRRRPVHAQWVLRHGDRWHGPEYTSDTLRAAVVRNIARAFICSAWPRMPLHGEPKYTTTSSAIP